jgi:hypothetical protein
MCVCESMSECVYVCVGADKVIPLMQRDVLQEAADQVQAQVTG